MVVAPGTAILEIGDPSDIEIEAEYSSRDAVAIKPGTPVEVDQWGGDTPLAAESCAGSSPPHFTKVSALGVEEQRVIVLSDLSHPPPPLKHSATATASKSASPSGSDKDALAHSSGALFREGNDWKTFVFDNDKARVISVQAGRTDGRMTQFSAASKSAHKCCFIRLIP